MKNKPNIPEATAPYTSNQHKKSHERGGDKKSTGEPYTSNQHIPEASNEKRSNQQKQSHERGGDNKINWGTLHKQSTHSGASLPLHIQPHREASLSTIDTLQEQRKR